MSLERTLIFTINKFKATHTKYFCIYGYGKRFRSLIRHILYLVLVKCRFFVRKKSRHMAGILMVKKELTAVAEDPQQHQEQVDEVQIQG
ncbi:hypothetical protein FQ021_11155 [Escherichia coli]|nr:hypothetical protein [Escherichia coli]